MSRLAISEFVGRVQCNSCGHCKLQNNRKFCRKCSNFRCNICAYQGAWYIHPYVYKCSICSQTYCIKHFVSHSTTPEKCLPNYIITLSENNLDNLIHDLPHSPANEIIMHSLPLVPINLHVLQWKITKINCSKILFNKRKINTAQISFHNSTLSETSDISLCIIEKCQRVISISIEGYNIKASLAQKLIGYNINVLRKISITNCAIADVAHATLAQIIGLQKFITDITLVKLSIGSNLTYYSNALKNLKRILRVELRENGIASQYASELLLCVDKKKLKLLDFSDNMIAPDIIPTLNTLSPIMKHRHYYTISNPIIRSLIKQH